MHGARSIAKAIDLDDGIVGSLVDLFFLRLGIREHNRRVVGFLRREWRPDGQTPRWVQGQRGQERTASFSDKNEEGDCRYITRDWLFVVSNGLFRGELSSRAFRSRTARRGTIPAE